MKITAIILSAVGVIAIIVFAVYGLVLNKVSQPGGMNFQTLPDPSTNQLTIDNSQTVQSNLTVGSGSGGLSGNYITGMAAEGFKNSTAGKIVLFFYADWCPTCRPVDKELKDNLTKIPAGVEIYRINYNDQDTDNEEKELAKKHGITYQHTFVQVDKEGNEIKKWNGGGLEKILAELE
jgi:thiol-disulfide isomerase/thioredoxin